MEGSKEVRFTARLTYNCLHFQIVKCLRTTPSGPEPGSSSRITCSELEDAHSPWSSAEVKASW